MLEIVETEVVWRGYVTVTRVTLADPAGGRSRREVVDFGSSACVLPYDPLRRTALLLRLPRAPLLLQKIDRQLLEAPAGMIGQGETPQVAIRREAMEEAGVELGALEPVGVCWPSPGVLAERAHLFLAPYGVADRKGPGGGLAEEHEAIRVEETPLARLKALADEGGLEDMKTLTLVLALGARRPELFEP